MNNRIVHPHSIVFGRIENKIAFIGFSLIDDNGIQIQFAMNAGEFLELSNGIAKLIAESHDAKQITALDVPQ
jgi:hypothetical protein